MPTGEVSFQKPQTAPDDFTQAFRSSQRIISPYNHPLRQQLGCSPGGEEGQDVLQALRHRVHAASLPPHPFTFFTNSIILSRKAHAGGEMLLRWRRADAQSTVFGSERVNAVDGLRTVSFFCAQLFILKVAVRLSDRISLPFLFYILDPETIEIIRRSHDME